MDKSPDEVFYIPMVRKATAKIQAVFDASAKLSTGVSLNITLFVGPTIHSPLIDSFPTSPCGTNTSHVLLPLPYFLNLIVTSTDSFGDETLMSR